jgi:hypothetical protein
VKLIIVFLMQNNEQSRIRNPAPGTFTDACKQQHEYPSLAIRHMDVNPPKTMKKKYCSALYSVLGNIDTETQLFTSVATSHRRTIECNAVLQSLSIH